jgi:hypothetical protein
MFFLDMDLKKKKDDEINFLLSDVNDDSSNTLPKKPIVTSFQQTSAVVPLDEDQQGKIMRKLSDHWRLYCR